MSNQNETPTDLAGMWEQMGVSTGGLVGRAIGQWAQYGLTLYEQMVINPLQQAKSEAGPPGPGHGVPPDIREQTWGEMGKKYGLAVGSSIGMAMDLFIQGLKNSSMGSSGSNPHPPEQEK